MSGIGHNKGPTLDAGYSWRKHSWSKARADLLPKLPIEILRRRVKRAQELGLPYKTYASVRASTGRDVVGFLFSNNALRVLRAHDRIAPRHADKLRSLVSVEKLALSHATVSVENLMARAGEAGVALRVSEAPRFNAPWQSIRSAVSVPLRDAGLPGDGVLVVGDTTHERLWCDAGRLAGFLSSDTYFR